MGQLLIHSLGQTQLVSLKEHTLIGRSPKCDVLINLSPVPNIWLELRYLNGEWIWNVLNGESDTIGSGGYTYRQWRKYIKPIRFQNLIKIELINQDAPTPLLEDANKRFHRLEEFPDIIQSVRGTFSLNGTHLPIGKPFIHQENIYTLWVPGTSHITEDTNTVSISDGSLWFDLDGLSATFDFGVVKFTAHGEAARVLHVYALAKQSDDPWLNTEDAFLDWVSLGGNADSPTDRINWERNKILGKLNKQGAFPLVDLFKRRKKGSTWTHCLDFAGEIHFEPMPSSTIRQ